MKKKYHVYYNFINCTWRDSFITYWKFLRVENPQRPQSLLLAQKPELMADTFQDYYTKYFHHHHHSDIVFHLVKNEKIGENIKIIDWILRYYNIKVVKWGCQNFRLMTYLLYSKYTRDLICNFSDVFLQSPFLICNMSKFKNLYTSNRIHGTQLVMNLKILNPWKITGTENEIVVSSKSIKTNFFFQEHHVHIRIWRQVCGSK